MVLCFVFLIFTLDQWRIVLFTPYLFIDLFIYLFFSLFHGQINLINDILTKKTQPFKEKPTNSL